MPVRVKANLRKYRTALNQRVIPGANLRVKEALFRDSKKEFRNRTGRLRRSIRVDSGQVAIGTRITHYWRFVRGFTRGDGRIWIRRSGEKSMEIALAVAARKAGLT